MKSSFNNYLRKYRSQFRCKVVSKGDDGVYKIHGKHAEISPYDIDRNLLGLWYMQQANRKVNTRRRNIILNTLNDHHVNYDLHQDGDIEFGLIFPERQLYSVCKVIEATRKKALSAEQKHSLEQRLKSGKSIKKNPCKSTLFQHKTDDSRKLMPECSVDEYHPKYR